MRPFSKLSSDLSLSYFSSYLTIVLALSLFLDPTFASPIPPVTEIITTPSIAHSVPSVETAKTWTKFTPSPGTCVFYTNGQKANAIISAKHNKRVTIYDIYDPALFDTTKEPAKTYYAQRKLREYWEVTSRAYAQLCSGQAFVMIPPDEQPNPKSIWITDEYDAIRKGQTRVRLEEVFRPSSVLGSWISYVYEDVLKGYGRKEKRSLFEQVRLGETTFFDETPERRAARLAAEGESVEEARAIAAQFVPREEDR